MNAIKSARRLIASDPTGETSRVLVRLVLSLESETEFALSSLYALDIDGFGLAMSILTEWRIDRYYVGKAKLFDLSHQVSQLSSS